MRLLTFMAVMLLVAAPLLSQNAGGIDPDALIERILAAEQQQRAEIEDVTFETEYIEYENKGEEDEKEKVRLIKKVYLKYLPDTTLFAEDYLEFYKDGKLKDQKELEKEAEKREEDKQKRKGRDISYPMLKPFYPGYRDLYNIEYLGVAEERMQDHVCHHFRVTAKEEADSLINGNYFFEAENFNLVKVEFTPAKLIKKTMFKLKSLDMVIMYGPGPEGYWLPETFEIEGQGKAALFFGVNFNGTEWYRNPEINNGLKESLFEVPHDD